MANEPGHEGIPFEERCQLATEGLKMLWSSLEKIMGDESEFFQGKQRELEERSVGKGEVLKGILKNILADQTRIHISGTEKLVAETWDGGVGMARIAFGDDAVNFALEMLKRERLLS